MDKAVSSVAADPTFGKFAAPEATNAAQAEIDHHQRRNFAALAIYQIVLRSGWIFKTESIIMPAVLDMISDRPWVRAMLPLLNRLGQSLPPMLMARRAQAAPRKSRMLLSTTLTMATCFLMLALLWLATGGQRSWWMPLVFLFFYGIFFASMGVNQLVFSTTQGKLIETTRRGRLLLFSNSIGAVIAIGCALLLLPQWLQEDRANVPAIFGFAAGCFFLSAGAVLFLREPADEIDRSPTQPILQQLAHVLAPLTYDGNFRRLMYVAAMYGASMGLFPHYQSVGREELGLPLDRLIWWLIMQNIGMGLFSFVAGPLADWFGNRLVLRISMLGLCIAPIMAVTMAAYGAAAAPWYDWVFVMVGLTPVMFRTLQNYTLEICEPHDHSRYLSAMSLGMASTLILSPVLGLMMEFWGFEPVFWCVILLIFSGWCVTFFLAEPRQAAPHQVPLDSEI